MTTISRTALLFVVAVGLGVTAAYAAGREPWTPSGVTDFAHHGNVTSAGGPATGRTPESKLFYTGAGRWWAVLGDASGGVSLFRLDDHAWQPQLTLPKADPWMKANTLFDEDNGILYVTLRDNKSLVSNPRENLLYELSYDGTGFTVVNSFPTRISTTGTESLTIARDTHGRLWTTYRVGSNIRVGYTSPGGTAFAFKTLASGVTSDDVSAVTSFGTSIGVMWSDQNAKRMFFASRIDVTDPDAGTRAGFRPAETAYGGGVGGCPAAKACADDHINLKVAGGEVHAAIKTGLPLGLPSRSSPPPPARCCRPSSPAATSTGTTSSFPRPRR
jgi:hypothetical protein